MRPLLSNLSSGGATQPGAATPTDIASSNQSQFQPGVSLAHAEREALQVNGPKADTLVREALAGALPDWDLLPPTQFVKRVSRAKTGV
jgi:hypothetical protein